jgi:hypothetical protein
VEKMHDGWKRIHGLSSRKNATVSGTNVQMEMVSRTHKCMMEMVSWHDGNGLMDS